MEKAFRHWGHDIGPEDTPLEAGLGFAVSRTKQHEFIGQEAIRRQRENGMERRLVQFAVEEAHPLLLHDEPLYRDGELAGHTTSGARGFRTGLSLCFACIPVRDGETVQDLQSSRFEISIAGDRFQLKPLLEPPYDPAGERMRRTTTGSTS